MDHRNTLLSRDGHLTDEAIEALASERPELLDDDARAHVADCVSCIGRIDEAKRARVAIDEAFHLPDGALGTSIDEALSAAGLGDAALSMMVEQAIEAELGALDVRAAIDAPSAPLLSRRSMAWAFALGSVAAIALALLSLGGLPSIAGTLSGFTRAWTIGGAAIRLVEGTVPGGGAGLSLVAPLRRLLGSPSHAMRAAALLLAAALSAAAPARALDFDGTWPEEEALTVVAEDVPASVALERAAEAAGLGFVGVLSADPPVHLRVRGASLRDVVLAVLGPDAPYVVQRTDGVLLVRAASSAAPPSAGDVAPNAVPAASPPAASPPAANPPAASPPARPAIDDAARRNARDRTSFGGDVRVGPGEVVASVVTFGGDADIQGEVLQDVVSMGGDIHVHSTGSVRGDIVAMGGAVEVDPGADVTPGAIEHTDGEWQEWQDWEDWDEAETTESPGDALVIWVTDTLASAARHTLLFLFGLLLLGLLPARLTMVTTTLREAPGRSVLTGALSAAAALVLGIVLVITLIGIPGAILLALVAAVASYAGLAAVAMILGRGLPIAALADKPLHQLAAGVAILFVTSLVPFFGTLALMIAALFGAGAIVLTRAGTRAA